MATDSFTSSSAAVSSDTLSVKVNSQPSVYTRVNNFRVIAGRNTVYITKAPSFGGTQAALTFPITRDAALELAYALINTCT
jgi:hypothetical protein